MRIDRPARGGPEVFGLKSFPHGGERKARINVQEERTSSRLCSTGCSNHVAISKWT